MREQREESRAAAAILSDMSPRAVVVGLAVLASTLVGCGSGSDTTNELLEELQFNVEELQFQIDDLASLIDVTPATMPWPESYQAIWVDVCTPVLDEVVDSEVPSTDLCRCTLDGLMSAFAVDDYERWDQDVKDGAAAPYVTMCMEDLADS